MESPQLTAPERRLERILPLFGLLFSGFVIQYILQGVLWNAEFPFVVNSAAKDGLLAVLCFIGAADIRRNGWAVLCVIGAHLIIVSCLLLELAFGDLGSVAHTFTSPSSLTSPAATTALLIWLALASGVTIALMLMYHAAAKSRYGLHYLHPHQHRTAMALAEVLVIGDESALTPEQVASNIDDYLFSFSAHEKWKSKLALSALTVFPLLRLKPPFALMSPQKRLEFIDRRFIADISERHLPGFLRRPLQSMLFGAHQLCCIGYYPDPRTAHTTGYVPFSKRERFESAMATVEADRTPLNVRTPSEVDTEEINADVVIVGSGAAGAILAHRLAGRGREVTVLELGKHVDPTTFTEDERIQFSNLFSDGGMQMSKDARFQVLQGHCVGGSTVINNAVCFDIPPHVLARWNDPDGTDAGLDEARLAAAYTELRRFLNVRSDWSWPATDSIAAGARKFQEGIDGLGLSDRFSIVDANITDCFGCGYCNIGCPYGKKLSALDLTLPDAQKRYGDAVRIYSECGVEKIETSNGRATGVRCKLSDGRELTVKANTVVVSAGALASSLVLQRSRLGGKLAGKHLGFNVGVPMTALFDEKLDSYDGVQISHYLRPATDDGLVLETWFNPVGTQALMMPGWFSEHYENMRSYDHMASAGSVIGSRRNASIKPGRRGKGMSLDYTPHPDDLRRVVDGLKLSGQIFLAAGAEKVMPLTFKSFSARSPEELDMLDEQVRDNTDIQLHTSHPQGGNAVSRDPGKGVVDEQFKVFGTENVYVCDASAFPSAITVNPQLTVMALAEYASAGIE